MTFIKIIQSCIFTAIFKATGMKRLIPILSLIFVFACNNNASSEDEMQEKLKSTMLNFLYEKIAHNDSSKVKYKIIGDVIYYDDDVTHYYDCEFKVRMSLPGRKDTVGTMGAYISKDFKEVQRFK